MKRVQLVGEVFPANVAQQRWGGEGQTLGGCLALAVDGVVSVGDPYGETHMISLAPFAREDSNHFLMFSFIELREDRENFGHIDHGNGVALKDYELPPGTAEMA
jgi:hypothetical protein